MGNKLWLVQHDELKGGIISMFIYLFEETCVHGTSANSHSFSSSLFLICWMSSVCVCVFACAARVHVSTCCSADILVCVSQCSKLLICIHE